MRYNHKYPSRCGVYVQMILHKQILVHIRDGNVKLICLQYVSHLICHISHTKNEDISGFKYTPYMNLLLMSSYTIVPIKVMEINVGLSVRSQQKSCWNKHHKSIWISSTTKRWMWGYKEYMHSTHLWIKSNSSTHDMAENNILTETKCYQRLFDSTIYQLEKIVVL